MKTEQQSKSLGYLPLDGRPVNLSFVHLLAASAGLTLDSPQPDKLGQLKTPADSLAVQRWMEKQGENWAGLILSLDMWSFGGLIPSRLSDQPVEALAERLEKLTTLLPNNLPVLAYSSITRTPNYNSAEEEPDYWATYGETLHHYSVAVHKKAGLTADFAPLLQPDLLLAHELGLPVEVVNDWLERRKIRWAYHRGLLAEAETGRFSALIFCQDDTEPWGFSAVEAANLRQLIQRQQLEANCWVQTGADELGMTCLARALNQRVTRPLKVWVATTADTGLATELPFDGASLETVLTQRLQATGLERCPNKTDADVWLLLHTPSEREGVGDHCGLKPASLKPEEQGAKALSLLEEAGRFNKPVALADVSYANGADPALMATLKRQAPDTLAKLYGYSAWNTPGNALGSALAMLSVRLQAERQGGFQPEAFKQALFTRLADDWLYQGHWRQQLRASTGYQFGKPDPPEALDPAKLNALMKEDLAWLQALLGLGSKTVQLSFPCNRTFEVAVDLA